MRPARSQGPLPHVRVTSEVTRLEAHVEGRLCGRVRDLRLLVQDNGVVFAAVPLLAKQPARHVVMEAAELPVLASKIGVEGVR